MVFKTPHGGGGKIPPGGGSILTNMWWVVAARPYDKQIQFFKPIFEKSSKIDETCLKSQGGGRLTNMWWVLEARPYGEKKRESILEKSSKSMEPV